jgi:plastocyanin
MRRGSRIYIVNDIILKLIEYGELSQTALISYCGINKIKHKSIIDDIVQDAYLMIDKAFSPNLVTVKVGDTVTWTNNDDSQPHTVTSGTGSDNPDKGKAFDSGTSALTTKGKTFQHTFTKVGEYPYFCELHPSMVGKVVVVVNSFSNR